MGQKITERSSTPINTIRLEHCKDLFFLFDGKIHIQFQGYMFDLNSDEVYLDESSQVIPIDVEIIYRSQNGKSL